jgi:hypothetical protein
MAPRDCRIMFDDDTEEMFERLAWMAQRQILALVLSPRDAPLPRTVDELIRAVGNRLDATAALTTLRRAGLIHCHGRRVFATQAAIKCWRLSRQERGPCG